MEELKVGTVWYGKIGTDFEGVEATIERITPRRVQVKFDKLVYLNKKQVLGSVFGKRNFLRLFKKQKYEQMSLFD